MQIISTTIIQLEEVFHIHLVSALHYVINSYINLVQNLGDARAMPFVRAEASRPVGSREGGVLGERDVPPPHYWGLPRRRSDFCGF